MTVCLYKRLCIIPLSIILGGLLVVIGYPVFALLYLHRNIVILLSKQKHGNTWIPTSITAGSHSTDEINEKGLLAVGNYIDVDKSFDYKGWISRIETFINYNKQPELKCFLYRWFGVYFLVPCKKFSIEQVISVDTKSKLTDDDVDSFLETYCFAAFQKENPLWEIRIFLNFKPNRITIALRFHHGLCDGLSAMRLLTDLSDFDPIADKKFKQTMSNIMEKVLPKRSLNSKLLIGLEILFVTPFRAAYNMLNSIENNMWSSAVCNGPLLNGNHVMDLTRLQKIAKGLKTNLVTLVGAVITGAVIEEMKSRGEPVTRDLAFTYVLPLPLQINETKLTTSLVSTIIPLPISDENMLQRLVTIDKNFKTVRRPAIMLYSHMLGLFGNLLGTLRGNKCARRPRFILSGGWSNLVIFLEDRKFMGKEIVHYKLKAIPPVYGVPIVFYTASYKNQMTLTVLVDRAIFKSKKELSNFLLRVEYQVTCYAKLSLE